MSRPFPERKRKTWIEESKDVVAWIDDKYKVMVVKKPSREQNKMKNRQTIKTAGQIKTNT